MRAILVSLACACAWPSIGAAQTPSPSEAAQEQSRDPGPLAGFLTRFVIEGARVSPGRTGVDRSRDFIANLPRTLTPLELNAALARQIALFPLGDASPEVPYPAEGASASVVSSPGSGRPDVTQGSRVGPLPRALMAGAPFRESALLVGRESFSMRLAYQTVTFNRIDGLDLDGGEIHVLLEDAVCCPGRVDRDLLRETVALTVEQQTAVVSGSYGLSPRVDVGFAVPLTRVELRGRVESRIVRVATGTQPAVHSFDGVDRAERTLYRTASATGIGDIRLRAKYLVLGRPDAALAAAVDLRTPTGRADDLLGLGAWQATALTTASRAWGRVGLRGGLGYTWSFGDLDETATTLPDAPSATVAAAVPNELSYHAGATVAVVSRVAASVDVIGRRLTNVPRFDARRSDRPSANVPAVPEFIRAGELHRLASDTLHAPVAVAGVKWTIAPAVLLGVDVLFPLSRAGLTPKVTPLVGLEYAF